jgi:hypothetical protein
MGDVGELDDARAFGKLLIETLIASPIASIRE